MEKTIVFLLAACMVLTLGGVATFVQAEPGDIAEVNGTPYATLDEVLAAVQTVAQQGQSVLIKLLQNVQIPSGKHIEVAAGMQVTLDFNGCTLSKTDESNDAPIENYGTMQIVDTKGGGGISGETGASTTMETW